MWSQPNPLLRRAAAVPVALACGVLVIGATGWQRLKLSEGIAPTEVHRPAERALLLGMIADAIVPVEREVDAGAACPELANVKKAIDVRLAGLTEDTPTQPAIVRQRYVLNLGPWAALDPTTCRKRARSIDAEIKGSFTLLRAPESWRENAYNKSDGLWRGRSWNPRLEDIDTKNAWGILAGCVRDAQGIAVAGVCEGSTARGIDQLVSDPQLAEGLAWHVNDVARAPSAREAMFRGKRLPVGRDIVLGFDRELQSRAGTLVRCFTGDTAACADVLPVHLHPDWHFQPGNLRAGAAAVVLVDVHSGRVVAAAGGVSECTQRNLTRKVEDLPDGNRMRTPLFRPGTDELCAQVPDSRGALGYLTVSPVFWLVAPGSTMKAKALLAAIESGAVPPGIDSVYRVMLAQSHDPDGRGQLVPQRLARQSAPGFSALLESLGFSGHHPQDVLLGGASGEPGWRLPVRGGFAAVPFSIDEASFLQIAAAKRLGRNADAMFGHKRVGEYLRAYRLGIAAIGSGDIRDSAWGLADYGRRLALRGEGAARMAPTRFADVSDAEPPEVSLDFAAPPSVRRLITMMSGGTARRIGGTAAGSCQVALGACPPDGHASVLFSKTGTSETGPGGEASMWIKDRGAGTPPAKLYMAVFQGADGRVYAGGAMTLRIREKPGSLRPELGSNSAAELLFLVAKSVLERKIHRQTAYTGMEPAPRGVRIGEKP